MSTLHNDNPCPQCASHRESLEARCSVCGWVPAQTRTPILQQAKISFERLLEAMRTTSIGSVLLLTAFVAFSLAFLKYNVAAGICMLIVGSVALGRTALYVLYLKAAGAPLSPIEKVLAFLQAALFVFVVALACQTTFVVICFPLAIASNNLWVGATVGGLCAIGLFICVLWCVPVYRDDRR